MSNGDGKFFSLTDNYAVGIQSIDEQHKTMADILNVLHRAYIDGRGEFELVTILRSLVEHTSNHFIHEENLMRHYNYSGFFNHKQSHVALLREVHELQYKIENEETHFTLALIHYVRTWLARHIVDSDKRLGDYLKKHCDIDKIQYSQHEQNRSRKPIKKKWWKFW